ANTGHRITRAPSGAGSRGRLSMDENCRRCAGDMAFINAPRQTDASRAIIAARSVSWMPSADGPGIIPNPGRESVNEVASMARAATGSQIVRVRRRRYFLLRVGDETTLDIARFLSGEISTKRNAQCWLLCPVSGKDLPITADELQLVMTLPA